MSASAEPRPVVSGFLWIGRVVGVVFVLLSLLAFSTVFDSGADAAVVVLAFLALAGSLVFLASLERPNHPWARWARLVGWQMMAAFSIVPTSSMYVSMVIVVLALPAVFAGFQRS